MRVGLRVLAAHARQLEDREFGLHGEPALHVREIGANTGRLTSVERDYDRFSGLPRMSNIPVRVARLASSG